MTVSELAYKPLIEQVCESELLQRQSCFADSDVASLAQFISGRVASVCQSLGEFFACLEVRMLAESDSPESGAAAASFLQDAVTLTGSLQKLYSLVCPAALSCLPDSLLLGLERSFQLFIASFVHCQRSVSIYGAQIHQVSAILSVLFRVSYTALMAGIQCLDSIDTQRMRDCYSVDELCKVTYALSSLAASVFEFEPRITVTAWKSLIRTLSESHNCILHDSINIDEIILKLLSLIRQMMGRIVQTGGSAQDAKIFNFLVKCQVSLLTEYNGQLSGCLSQLFYTLTLLRAAYRRLADRQSSDPSSVNPELLSAKLRGSPLVGIERLLTSAAFAQVAIGASMAELQRLAGQSGIGDDCLSPDSLCLALIELKCYALTLLPKQPELDDSRIWLDKSDLLVESNLYDSLFKTLEQAPQLSLLDCSLEIGHSHTGLDYYHCAALSIITSACHLPKDLVSHLEKVVIKIIFDPNSRALLHLLATDVLCFLLRYSSTAFCAQWVSQLAKSLASLDYRRVYAGGAFTEQRLQLAGRLFARIVKFAADADLLTIFDQYPFSERHYCLYLWLNFNSLSLSSVQQQPAQAALAGIVDSLVAAGLENYSAGAVISSDECLKLSVLLRLVPNLPIQASLLSDRLSASLSRSLTHAARCLPGIASSNSAGLIDALTVALAAGVRLALATHARPLAEAVVAGIERLLQQLPPTSPSSGSDCSLGPQIGFGLANCLLTVARWRHDLERQHQHQQLGFSHSLSNQQQQQQQLSLLQQLESSAWSALLRHASNSASAGNDWYGRLAALLASASDVIDAASLCSLSAQLLRMGDSIVDCDQRFSPAEIGFYMRPCAIATVAQSVTASAPAPAAAKRARLGHDEAANNAPSSAPSWSAVAPDCPVAVLDALDALANQLESLRAAGQLGGPVERQRLAALVDRLCQLDQIF